MSSRKPTCRCSMNARRISAAQLGSSTYGITENIYLSNAASTTDYAVTIEAHADGTRSYDEVTTLRMKEFAEPFLHTDHNRLHRAG
jgi:hypothetical protein